MSSDRWSRTALSGSVVTATIVAHPRPYLKEITVDTNRYALWPWLTGSYPS
jgi:hypothetical protein